MCLFAFWVAGEQAEAYGLPGGISIAFRSFMPHFRKLICPLQIAQAGSMLGQDPKAVQNLVADLKRPTQGDGWCFAILHDVKHDATC